MHSTDSAIANTNTSFYPVLFAVPRCVGWLAHWRQMMLQPGGVKIWRPRQLYVGEGARDYVERGNRNKKPAATVFDSIVQLNAGAGDSKRHQLATYKDETGRTWGKAKL